LATVVHINRLLSIVTMQSEDTYHLVQARYGELAEYASSSETKGCEDKVATAFGYDSSELRSLPENANLGVSCGNPLATAKLREVGI
jgi:arsenite methyltransferase